MIWYLLGYFLKVLLFECLSRIGLASMAAAVPFSEYYEDTEEKGDPLLLL